MYEQGKNNVMYTKLTVPKRDSVTRLKTTTEFPVMDMENLWLPAHIYITLFSIIFMYKFFQKPWFFGFSFDSNSTSDE
jgi:hypothetical protein